VQSIQRHNLKAAGGTCAFVGERNGAIEAFIIGSLDRVYHIGTKLMAQDLYFLSSPEGAPRSSAKLIDAYIEWATAIPDLIEINISVTSVISKPERVEKLFIRKGFSRSGAMFERAVQ
jgi:hypothetical protein